MLLAAATIWIGCSGLHAAQVTPVIVELFTSEGCSDCPPADTLLDKLIEMQPVTGAQIIGLGEHVTYWDQLGWKDRFSAPALTSRQEGYQSRFRTESIYTPQMVVDGRLEFVGSNANAARKAIEQTLAAPHGSAAIDVDGGHVSVTMTNLPKVAHGDHADIVIMVTESGLSSDVKGGENHGKILKHAPVVRYLATIGRIGADETSGSARADLAIDGSWQRDHLAIVAFAQENKGRAILASASAALK